VYGAGDVDFVVKRWMEMREEMPAEVTDLVVKRRTHRRNLDGARTSGGAGIMWRSRESGAHR
jgi:hypothetical protein